MSLFPCHSIKQGPGPGWMRATVGLSSWNLFAHNEGAFSKKKLPSRKRSSMDLPKGHLQHEEKRECVKQSRSFQFDSYRGTYVDSNSSTHAERLANPNSPFVTETENLCLSFTSHKNSEPLVQATNTCKFSNHLNFSWTSGLSSWASDLSNSLAQCLQCPETLVSSAEVELCAFLQLSGDVTFHVCFLDSFFHCPSPVGTITCSVVWINFTCFEVTFASVHELQGWAPDFPDSYCQLSV